MSTVSASPIPLPNDPSLEQLRKQARELQGELRRDDPAVKLSTAQRLVARKYGFPSWPKLVRHVEVIARYTWRPDDEPSGGAAPADELLRLGCLTYTNDDGPGRWERARAILTADPSLARASVHTASACADVEGVRAFLARDASLATLAGGPYGWSPLMYLVYSRFVPDLTELT